MSKRAAVIALAIISIVWMSGVVAQRGGQPQIGFLTLISLKSDSRIPSFIDGLRSFGYIEEQSIAIEWRSAEGQAERLPALAADLVQRKVALIVAVQPQAVVAARQVTRDIPIIFAAAQDPVGMGLASSLSRPGGNVTGTSGMATDLLPKQLELLRLAIPSMSRIAVLLNPTNAPGSQVIRKTAEAAAAEAKIDLLFFNVQTIKDVHDAFGRARSANVNAVLAGPDSFFVQARDDMAKAALSHRLPTMFMQREHAVAGGMMSYGPNIGENYRRVAYYVDRVLKGAKAGELPIEQPAKLDLIINDKTAKALGIVLPSSLLLRADEVLR